MSASLGLFRLQQIDSQIAQIETSLAKIQKTLEDHAGLQAALEKLNAAQAEERAAQRTQHRSEDEAHSQQVKIQQAESSLYGGTVRNPKELQDLQADIASLKKHLASLEERELQDMLRTEDAQAAVKRTQGELNGVEARLGSEHRQLFEDRESLTRELNRLQAERQAALSTITADALKIYNELREQRRGVAVAEVSDNACGACGITLTAAIQQNARYAVELVRCPSCGRILYAV
ncbi:MAG TPA: C4-type zinc ribbon domain-containing protein [Anaerolineales bacterium]|nr:C4-type zinc ribbon domain-containing protein [Anaerolineales bacterium]